MQSSHEVSGYDGLEIYGFIENSFVDWDGMIASIIFLPRCNMRCPFCHNSELVLSPEKYEDKRIEPDKIISFLSSNKEWIDGLTVTGGEPTLHLDRLLPFLKRVKDIGIKIKIDTNGIMPSAIRILAEEGVVDYIAMDVKSAIEPEMYSKACGIRADTVKIKESIDYIISSGIDHEFRTTVVPGISGKMEVMSIAKDIKGCKRYVLQKFRPDKTLSEDCMKIRPYTDEQMEDMLDSVKWCASEAYIR